MLLINYGEDVSETLESSGVAGSEIQNPFGVEFDRNPGIDDHPAIILCHILDAAGIVNRPRRFLFAHSAAPVDFSTNSHASATHAKNSPEVRMDAVIAAVLGSKSPDADNSFFLSMYFFQNSFLRSPSTHVERSEAVVESTSISFGFIIASR